ncbi:DUF6115 domain-containing protein [Paenibacillus pinihumi]|uniref:DUF6115 domain-containing protein n=1 Tax=Paenibacillus pinihumi TaxID=669462 RepID=UPI000417B374|nr:hypothetical protein [Paenibacillus pinihumi]
MNQPWQYLVLLGAFAVVMAFVMPRKHKQATQADQSSISDMELALEQFMQTMEADNKEFVAMISRTQQELRDTIAVKEQRIAQLENRCGKLEKELADKHSSLEARIAGLGSQTAVSVSKPSVPSEEPLPAGEEDQPADLIKDRYAELLKLYNQGKSVDYIARKLGLNKGEVQLIVQLSIQEERHRV